MKLSHERIIMIHDILSIYPSENRNKLKRLKVAKSKDDGDEYGGDDDAP